MAGCLFCFSVRQDLQSWRLFQQICNLPCSTLQSSCNLLPAAGGAQPPAVRTTARPYTAGRPTPPRTASLLSGNSVLRADFFRRRLTPPRLVSVFKDSVPGTREESPPRSSPQRVSGARQQIINLRQLAVDCKSASTCKSASVCPTTVFSDVRLIRVRGRLVL